MGRRKKDPYPLLPSDRRPLHRTHAHQNRNDPQLPHHPQNPGDSHPTARTLRPMGFSILSRHPDRTSKLYESPLETHPDRTPKQRGHRPLPSPQTHEAFIHNALASEQGGSHRHSQTCRQFGGHHLATLRRCEQRYRSRRFLIIL